MKKSCEECQLKIFKEILADTSTLILQKKLGSYDVGLYLKLANCPVCLVICLWKCFVK